MNNHQTTVIVGGGFVGLFTALYWRYQATLNLGYQKAEHSLVLVDPQQRFVFKPMLYELLTEELPEDVVCPTYQELLQGSPIELLTDRVDAINLKQKQLQLASGEQLSYDSLVLSVGSIQGYLGTPGAEEQAFAFRSRDNAIALKAQLKQCLQKAKTTTDESERRALLTVAIVGAGPAGVEMAATLADLLADWYAELKGNIHEIRLVLINHGAEILSGDVNANLRDVVHQSFKERAIPVELMMGVGVKAVYGDRLQYQHKDQPNPETLYCGTTIWTAGTATHPLIETLKDQIPSTSLNRHGLLLVNENLQLLDYPEVFAAGDCVEVKDHRQPALAQVAYQQAGTISHNLIALSQGNPLKSSSVMLRGTLMKLGLRNGVANLFDKIEINHQIGHLIRNATYIEMLPTPLHDFKATDEWLKEEIFHRHTSTNQQIQQPPEPPAKRAEKREHRFVKALAIVVPILFGLAIYWGMQTPSNEKIRPSPTAKPQIQR